MVTRNFWIGALVILVIAAGIWSLYRTYQNRVQQPTDQQLSSPAPTTTENFPDADIPPSPGPADALPATGIAPQTLPATGGN